MTRIKEQMQPAKMHGLLRRQLKRCFGETFSIPEEWRSFVDLVNSAYHESDTDRNMLERSMELSSQELLQANSEMRAIFEAVPDIFFRVDFSGTILDCKSANTSDLFVSRKNLIGKKIYDIPFASVSDRFRNALEEVQKTNAAVNFEYSILLQEKEVFFEARLIPLLEDQTIIIIRNVTDRKHAEEELQDNEAKLQAIFNQIDTGIMIIDRDSQIILETNKKVSEMMQLGRNKIIGQVCHEFVCPAERGKCPVKDLGQTVDQSEKILLKADGSRVNILKTVHPIVIKGRKCFLESFIDISERKQAEEALREKEQLFRLITDNVQDTVWIMDMNLKTTWISPSVTKTRGYSLAELKDMPLDKHLTPESLLLVLEIEKECLSPEKLMDPNEYISAEAELEYYRKDGSTMWADTVLTLLRDSKGMPAGILGVARGHDGTSENGRRSAGK